MLAFTVVFAASTVGAMGVLLLHLVHHGAKLSPIPSRQPNPPLPFIKAPARSAKYLAALPSAPVRRPRPTPGAPPRPSPFSLSPSPSTCDTPRPSPPCRTCRTRTCSFSPASGPSIPPRGLDAEVDVVVERGVITRVGPRRARKDLLAAQRVRVVERAGRLAPARPSSTCTRTCASRGRSTRRTSRAASRAAAAGGFVDVCCMPNTRPVNDTRVVTEMLVAKARALGGVRAAPHRRHHRRPEGRAAHRDGRPEGRRRGRRVRRRALRHQQPRSCAARSSTRRTFDLPVIQHAEDHALTEGAQMHEGAVSTRLGLRGWPRVAEDVIVARDVLLAEYAGARYHVAHVSTLGAVRILREAQGARRRRHRRGDAAPPARSRDEALLGYDTACKVNPPLREAEDVEALRARARRRDHRLHRDRPRAARRPREGRASSPRPRPGMIGLELCVPLLLGLVRDGRAPARAPRRRAHARRRRASSGSRRRASARARGADLVARRSRARAGRSTPRALRIEEHEHAVRWAARSTGRVEMTMCAGRDRLRRPSDA